MRRLTLIIFIIVVIVTILMAVLTRIPSSQTTPITNPPVPTEFPTVNTNSNTFGVVSFPSQSYLKNISVIGPIEIEFNQPILKESIQFTITPSTETVITTENGGKKLVISPTKYWIPNEAYSLKITSVSGNDGRKLSNLPTITFTSIIKYDEFNNSSNSTGAEASNPK